MTVEITFSDLHVPGPEPGQKLPLAQLQKQPLGHIHGLLSISINGRPLPYLGYWGPEDTCLGTWAEQLALIANALSASPSSEYIFDEGEEGQPAFQFRREGSEVRVSIVDSAVSDGEADPAWQGVPCLFVDLHSQIQEFLKELRSEIERQAPSAARKWWSRVPALK